MNDWDRAALQRARWLDEKVGEAGAAFAVWMMALIVPVMIADDRIADLWDWKGLLIAGLVALFMYQALKDGSRKRIIIRVVVPWALFAVSSIMLYAGLWHALLTRIRS